MIERDYEEEKARFRRICNEMDLYTPAMSRELFYRLLRIVCDIKYKTGSTCMFMENLPLELKPITKVIVLQILSNINL